MKKNTVIAVTGIVLILAVLGIYKFSTRNAKAPDNTTSTAEPKQVVETGSTVKLFYYDPLLDRIQGTNNLKCSRSGLDPVTRVIPTSTSPIKDTITLLLRGELSNEEKQAGATTEFPLPGFALTGTALKNGVLTLSFVDPQNKTSGGSCRTGILWFQIEATAKQFPGVTQVKFLPTTLFQP
jgi:hypothetical protein